MPEPVFKVRNMARDRRKYKHDSDVFWCFCECFPTSKWQWKISGL